MIRHFLLRDLSTHRLSWLLLGLVTSMSLLLREMGVNALPGLGYLFLLFPVINLQQISGVNWRSQHVMSRKYLLALPVSRQQLFAVLILRALVFAIPAFVFLSLSAIWWAEFHDFFRITDSWLYFNIITVAGLVWMLSLALSMQVEMERITGFLSLQERVWSWTKYLVIYIGEVILFLTAVIPLAELTPGYFPVVAAILFARLRYARAQVLWVGR